MDIVVLNEESNVPDHDQQFLSGRKNTTPLILHVLKHAGSIDVILIHSIQTNKITIILV